MIFTESKIFELLPAIYRIRDEDHGGALKALIDVIAGQAKICEEDIGRLYSNWFIETCEEWLIPYIGDLLGVHNFHAISGTSVISQRAYIANTLSYRRRKGVAPVLEQLSLDIAGWRAHVVEFFELLATSQNVNHVRINHPVVPDLRNMDKVDLLNTAFDTIAHSADMRHISTGRGRYNITSIGLFVWRLQNYPVKCSDAGIVSWPENIPCEKSFYFTFDPCGSDCHLFNSPKTEIAITHISEEVNVPGQLRRSFLYDELDSRRQSLVNGTDPDYVYFDDRCASEDDPSTRNHPVFEIFHSDENNNDILVPPEEIMICTLEKCCKPPSSIKYRKLLDDGTYSEVDMPVSVVADPVLGRFMFTDPNIKVAKVNFSYGYAGDIGAGPYNRHDSVSDFISKNKVTWQVGVSSGSSSSIGIIVKTIKAAIDEWNAQPCGTVGIITIMDSRTYSENLEINISEKSRLLIVAADWPVRINSNSLQVRLPGDISATGLRPHIKGNITVNGIVTDDEEILGCDKKNGGDLVLNGLLIEGRIIVPHQVSARINGVQVSITANLGSLTFSNCTIVPGYGGIETGADIPRKLENPLSNKWLKIYLQKCICGPVNLYKTAATIIVIEDCILDHSSSYGLSAQRAPVELNRTTVFGKVHAKIINAENCIFTGTVKAERRQIGCIRFSFLPGKNPETPRRFRCQPELEISTRKAIKVSKSSVSLYDFNIINDEIRKCLIPHFTSEIYGHHAYAQLSDHCPLQITAGADNGSEMGVFNFLKQPQRRANLLIALEEYLPFGLEAGILYVT
jgi:hypothetical protein